MFPSFRYFLVITYLPAGKDLADIARLLERFPRLRDDVPQSLLDRLVD